MKSGEFYRHLDEKRLQAAIAAAELKTSGEIRVLVTHREVKDPVAAAREVFRRHGMDRTRGRNAVLIFVAPVSRTFAILGDEAVHARCGQSFWEELSGLLGDFFTRGRYTEGLVEIVARTGSLLGEHFPRACDDIDELPDRVLGDGDR